MIRGHAAFPCYIVQTKAKVQALAAPPVGRVDENSVVALVARVATDEVQIASAEAEVPRTSLLAHTTFVVEHNRCGASHGNGHNDDSKAFETRLVKVQRENVRSVVLVWLQSDQVVETSPVLLLQLGLHQVCDRGHRFSKRSAPQHFAAATLAVVIAFLDNALVHEVDRTAQVPLFVFCSFFALKLAHVKLDGVGGEVLAPPRRKPVATPSPVVVPAVPVG
mmetsp:Transcript_45451/g.91714  ORF Transcript_45451/g.91714 Transcript_45451/m.91714 type:complete len:221 (+) Transcript_45451:270-932(+)